MRLASAVSDAFFLERIAGCRSSVLWPGAAAMSKASAQKPSAIFHVIYGFELPATKRLILSVVCLISLIERGLNMNEFSERDMVMLYSGAFYWVVMLFVLVWSYKKGGAREVFENLFLGLLLYFALLQVWLPPVDFEEKVVSALFFIAFGLCRIAKKIANKSA
jgi:hypothetical protein